MSVNITEMVPEDWERVAAIYQEGIDTRNATFETCAPSWEMWNTAHLPKCRLIARDGNLILGWAALSPTSKRPVYAGVAESSVYVGKDYRGKGIGNMLLDALIVHSEKNGLWTLQAGIFPENVASISLHKNHGFRVVGMREKIGKMNGVWRDVLLMERRSHTVGAT